MRVGVAYEKADSELYGLFGIESENKIHKNDEEVVAGVLNAVMSDVFAVFNEAAEKAGGFSVADDPEDYVPVAFSQGKLNYMVMYPISLIKEDDVSKAFLSKVVKLVEVDDLINKGLVLINDHESEG